jgi:hypothetical protein
VDDVPIEGDEKHRARNQSADGAFNQRISDRDSTGERRISSARSGSRGVGAARNDKATHGRCEEKSNSRHMTRKIVPKKFLDNMTGRLHSCAFR